MNNDPLSIIKRELSKRNVEDLVRSKGGGVDVERIIKRKSSKIGDIHEKISRSNRLEEIRKREEEAKRRREEEHKKKIEEIRERRVIRDKRGREVERIAGPLAETEDLVDDIEVDGTDTGWQAMIYVISNEGVEVSINVKQE